MGELDFESTPSDKRSFGPARFPSSRVTAGTTMATTMRSAMLRGGAALRAGARNITVDAKAVRLRKSSRSSSHAASAAAQACPVRASRPLTQSRIAFDPRRSATASMATRRRCSSESDTCIERVLSSSSPPSAHPMCAFPISFPTTRRTESFKLDTATMGAGDVLVKMVAAPITPADLAQVTGFAGRSSGFPRVGGNEGVGVVQAAGDNSGLKAGDVVVASKGGVGESRTARSCAGQRRQCRERTCLTPTQL
jgi:hypothetical protein